MTNTAWVLVLILIPSQWERTWFTGETVMWRSVFLRMTNSPFTSENRECLSLWLKWERRGRAPTQSSTNSSKSMILKYFFPTLFPHHSVSQVLGELIVPCTGHCGLPWLCPGSAHAHWVSSLWWRWSSVPRLGRRPPRSAQWTNPENPKEILYSVVLDLTIILWHFSVNRNNEQSLRI